MRPSNKLQASVLLQINATVHHFVQGKKEEISSGNCKFAKLIYFFVINHFYFTLTKSITFAKIQYPQTVSYLFPHWQSGVCAISFHIKSQEICMMDQILRNTATLKEFKCAMENSEFSKLIEMNCPLIQKNEISPPGKIKLALQKTGQYISEKYSTATEYFSKNSQKTEEALNKQVEQGKAGLEKRKQQRKQQYEKEAQHIQKKNEQSWEKIKQGTGKLIKVSQQYFNKLIWNRIDQNQLAKKAHQGQNEKGIDNKQDRKQNITYKRKPEANII